LDFLGPQIDVTSSQVHNVAKVSFEVDKSLVRPGHVKGYGFSFKVVRPGVPSGDPGAMSFYPQGSDSPMADQTLAEKLPGGGFRLTTSSVFGTSFDLFQESWFMYGYGMDKNLPEAIAKGVKVWMKTNYVASESWRITVSSGVARALKLKSTTIARASFSGPAGKDRRVRLTAAARRALRKYKRVKVQIHLTATGPAGTKRSSRSHVLQRPKGELE
jgi:hypothetical protein